MKGKWFKLLGDTEEEAEGIFSYYGYEYWWRSSSVVYMATRLLGWKARKEKFDEEERLTRTLILNPNPNYYQEKERKEKEERKDAKRKKERKAKRKKVLP